MTRGDISMTAAVPVDGGDPFSGLKRERFWASATAPERAYTRTGKGSAGASLRCGLVDQAECILARSCAGRSTGRDAPHKCDRASLSIALRTRVLEAKYSARIPS